METIALKTKPVVEPLEQCGVFLEEQERHGDNEVVCTRPATIDVQIGRDGHGIHTRLCEQHAAFFAGCLTELFAELRRGR